MTTENEFLRAYNHIKRAQDEVFKEMEKGIQLEKRNQLTDAKNSFELSLQLIDNILKIPVGLPDNIDNVGAEWNDACDLIQKLIVTKSDISDRLNVLRNHQSFRDTEAVQAQKNQDNEMQGSHKKKGLLAGDPVTQSNQSNEETNETSRETFKQILKDLRNILADESTGVLFDTFFQSQVKLYHIATSGAVQTLAGKTSMSLVMCTVGGQYSHLNGLHFIQCSFAPQTSARRNGTAAGEFAAPSTSQEYSMVWTYPLLPNLTKCHRTEFGAFIFPDMESDTVGSAFGLILCAPDGFNEDEFHDHQQFFLELLEATLNGTVEEYTEPVFTCQGDFDASEVVSRRVLTAANFVARNLVKGAEKTGELMTRTTPYIISKMSAAPENAPHVSSGVQTTVQVAKGVTNAAVGVTSWVAGKVGSASMALGRFLAPHIQYHGTNLLQRTCNLDNEQAQTKMEGVLTVAAGAVEGFSTIVDGLEKSAAILGNNISENSVKIIEHKYGSSAGNLAAGTFDTLGNAFVVSRNANYMLPKGIAKKMVKNTGRAVVGEYKPNIQQESRYIAAGNLYPDLKLLKENVEKNK
ncbi:protein spartin [Glossina fuscipes]|uniref:Protein spartin n=1 Tax=Glossina fuscipes TaxID=7396 RepID=A0A9C5Z383_9MUSC|nr:protein spartin [Glossina fuscipes]XP_037892257.1 protein spartin [Glossina fuscipes]XP_037892258.1 protein spartin [Glossina fuscipes]XP_037892259.1 protein spartin [Glossina fuscipes]XP_037892260.1 protein spartin [Glossina fuscipes]